MVDQLNYDGHNKDGYVIWNAFTKKIHAILNNMHLNIPTYKQNTHTHKHRHVWPPKNHFSLIVYFWHFRLTVTFFLFNFFLFMFLLYILSGLIHLAYCIFFTLVVNMLKGETKSRKLFNFILVWIATASKTYFNASRIFVESLQFEIYHFE